MINFLTIFVEEGIAGAMLPDDVDVVVQTQEDPGFISRLIRVPKKKRSRKDMPPKVPDEGYVSISVGEASASVLPLSQSTPISMVSVDTIFAIGQKVSLLHKDNPSEVVGEGTITALPGSNTFHTRTTKRDHYRIDVGCVFDKDAPLLEPNLDDDPPQLTLGQALGTSTLWIGDRMQML